MNGSIAVNLKQNCRSSVAVPNLRHDEDSGRAGWHSIQPIMQVSFARYIRGNHIKTFLQLISISKWIVFLLRTRVLILPSRGWVFEVRHRDHPTTENVILSSLKFASAKTDRG